MSPMAFISTSGHSMYRVTQSSDGTWSAAATVSDQDVRCLAVDPLNAQIVYAGTYGAGVLRSLDGGASWKNVGPPGQIVKAITASPIQPGTIYAGAKPPLMFVSGDYGDTWNELTAFRKTPGRWWWRSPAEMPLTAYVQAIGLSPTDPNVIVAGIEAGAVVRSADGGTTWVGHRAAALRDCHSLTFHRTDGRYVYEAGGTGAGAAISRDAGATWTQLRDGLEGHYGWACAADPVEPETWYVSTSKGMSMQGPVAHQDGRANAHIYRSIKGGAWQALGGGLPEPINDMAYALITDPSAPGHLYAGLANGDVWHSADQGDTWRQLPLHLPGIHQSLIMA